MLAQQVLFYLLETERLVLLERKRRSIPGTVVEASNTLFTSEDMKREKTQAQITAAGAPKIFLGQRRTWRFPICTGPKFWRYKPQFRGQPMAGKGKGSWRAWSTKGRHGASFQGKYPPFFPSAVEKAGRARGSEHRVGG